MGMAEAVKRGHRGHRLLRRNFVPQCQTGVVYAFLCAQRVSRNVGGNVLQQSTAARRKGIDGLLRAPEEQGYDLLVVHLKSLPADYLSVR